MELHIYSSIFHDYVLPKRNLLFSPLATEKEAGGEKCLHQIQQKLWIQTQIHHLSHTNWVEANSHSQSVETWAVQHILSPWRLVEAHVQHRLQPRSDKPLWPSLVHVHIRHCVHTLPHHLTMTHQLTRTHQLPSSWLVPVHVVHGLKPRIRRRHAWLL